MKIKSISVENFTVFREKRKIGFCDGINVLIGANGTGKSHLLKLVYSVMKAAENGHARSTLEASSYENRLALKLAGVFKPDDDGINRLIHRTAGMASNAKVALTTTTGGASFEITGKNNLRRVRAEIEVAKESIFLPSREVLAMYEGFVASYKKRELSFDETYADVCDALSATQMRGKKQDFIKKLVKPLEDAVGGKIRLEGNRFYLVMNDGGKVEAHLLAEGWRKLGSVVQLIANGSLMENGFLFWDEPEANLNPKMVRTIVQFLTRLAAKGIQVFVATHDYLLSGELSLMAEYPEQLAEEDRVPIRFIGLSRTETGAVDVTEADSLPQLAENPILDEFAAHYDRENQYLIKS